MLWSTAQSFSDRDWAQICPVPMAEYFTDSKVSLFYHYILENNVTMWFELVCGLQGTG